MIPGSGRSPGEWMGYPLQYSWAFLLAQLVKNVPAMQETWVQSLGWEDPLEKGKATHSSILTWEFHRLYGPWGHKESNTTERLSLFNEEFMDIDFFKLCLFILLFIFGVLGLCCCMGFSLVVASGGYSLAVVHQTSRCGGFSVVEHRL